MNFAQTADPTGAFNQLVDSGVLGALVVVLMIAIAWVARLLLKSKDSEIDTYKIVTDQTTAVKAVLEKAIEDDKLLSARVEDNGKKLDTIIVEVRRK